MIDRGQDAKGIFFFLVATPRIDKALGKKKVEEATGRNHISPFFFYVPIQKQLCVSPVDQEMFQLYSPFPCPTS